MSEIRKVRESATWYSSYMDDEQGRSLVSCMYKKIKQFDELIETVLAEIELAEEPKEVSEDVLIQSIKQMLQGIPTISEKDGYYVWEV